MSMYNHSPSSSSEKRPLEGLPEMIQSQILSSFCDGKSISTYFHVLLTNHHLRPYAFDILRDALVDRYKNLASERMGISNEEEVRDVIDIVREDIRKCNNTTNNKGAGVESRSVVTLVSEWCAIADYFELKLPKPPAQPSSESGAGAGADASDVTSCNREYVVWCGQLDKHGITIERAILTTPYWTITALDYFHSEMELYSNSYLTHPATIGILNSFLSKAPYGSLQVHLHSHEDPDIDADIDAMRRMQYSMSTDPDSQRYYLVPNQMEWEPMMGFSLNLDDPKSLACQWDGEDGGDFDYSLSHLATNVIRIMKRMNGDDDDDEL